MQGLLCHSLQGSIHIIGGAVVDREHNSLTIDSMGRGVMSFNILVVNAATTGTFSSTAMVRREGQYHVYCVTRLPLSLPKMKS